jgi:hypothetical protein
MRDESPADQRQFTDGFLGILTDDGDRLGRSDVEAGSPVFFA